MSSIVKNYPHVKCPANIVAKFFPSENNHVYSNTSEPAVEIVTTFCHATSVPEKVFKPAV